MLAAFAVHEFKELASTQDEALRRLAAGERDFVVRADAQTAGRGRRGRAWTGEPGASLLASFGLALPPGKNPGELPFALALALRDAAAARLPAGTRLTVKWPNDLWLDGKKLAGLLGEARPDGAGGTLVALGCGVNLSQREFPPELLAGATSLELGGAAAATPREFLAALRPRFAARFASWFTGGLSALRDELERHSEFHPGEPLRAELESGAVEGACAGLSPEGGLRLRTARGEMTLLAADVSRVRRREGGGEGPGPRVQGLGTRD